MQQRGGTGSAHGVLHTLVLCMLSREHAVASVQFAYYLLFSFFPALIFLNALLGLLEIPTDRLVEAVGSVAPQGVTSAVSLYLLHLSLVKSPALLLSGFWLCFLSAQRAVRAVIEPLARAFHAPHQRSPVGRWGFTLLFFVAVVLTLVVLVAGEGLATTLGEMLHISNEAQVLWTALSTLAVVAVVVAMLCALYGLCPGRWVGLRFLLPGAATALVLFGALSVGFRAYVSNIARYSLIYGSLGTVIVLMIWLSLTGRALLIGGELNATLFERAGQPKRRKQK